MTSPVRTRLTGAGLLAGAVAAVVALDTGVVPLPYSAPRGTAATTAADVRAGAATATRTPSAVPRDPREKARDDGIDASLVALTAALRSGPVSAVDALAAPGQKKVRARLRMLAANTRAIPGVAVRVERDPDPGLVTEEPDGDVGLVLRLRARTAPATTDDTDVVVAATVRKAGGRWVLARWEPTPMPANDVVGTPVLLPWRISGVRRGPALVVGDAKYGRLNTRLANRLEDVTKEVRTLLTGTAWDGTVVAFAMLDDRFLDRAFGEGVAGRGDPLPYWWFVSEVERGNVRLVLGSNYVLDRVEPDTLRYLVCYRATQEESTDSVPSWMRQGLALYASTRTGTTPDAGRALERVRLESATRRAVVRGTWKPSLALEPKSDISDAASAARTDSAWLAWFYVADTFGEAKVRELWAAAASAGRSTSRPADVEKAALQDALGVDRATFVRDVRRYASRILRS